MAAPEHARRTGQIYWTAGGIFFLLLLLLFVTFVFDCFLNAAFNGLEMQFTWGLFLLLEW